MALAIETFCNLTGKGSVFFKAVGHPLCLDAARAIVEKIKAARCAAAYDSQNTLTAFAAIHPLAGDDFSAVYAQDVARFDMPTLGLETRPITALAGDGADLLFVPIFDSAPVVAQIAHAAPAGCEIVTLDEMRLPERFLSDARRYLNPLNFTTNLLFFRAQENAHTRLTTANYWSAYGAKEPFVWGRLFDGNGRALADFEKSLGSANESFCLDSAQFRREFNLPDFCGQVFLHVVRAAGHDIVKYVADSYGDFAAETTELSCTHDANSWPADLYAGIPAPGDGDSVVLWVQNSHPSPIPAHAIGVNRMGCDKIETFAEEISPFATCAINLGKLLPEVKWPAQIEVRAGRHFVRPRYEVINSTGRRRINHANVERVDLSTDKNLPRLSKWLGKGYILPAPILPRTEFTSECLPTPMSTAQKNLPLAAVAYNSSGKEMARRFLGCLPRDHQSLLNLSEFAATLNESESGHVELVYDFSDGGDGDGWLHALFRYTHKSAGHMAETSFGAHMFNHLLTYKNEPQSYKGPPPGLTTRLFLRISPLPVRTFCHLIYPVSTRWNPQSDTHLQLKNRRGEVIAEKTVRIAAGGSLYFCCQDLFDAGQLQEAGKQSYLTIRDITCRLFGYHGAQVGDAFAFDHMFGF
ncbi:MAG: hypothetical protein OXU43_06030 [Gammaproteobacteria bacterium]|nr:hypothetical protein [Gammaproteobacteria bacterium]